MGREIKRVPIGFDWPKDKIWQGYLNPHYKDHYRDCADCNGRGSTIALQRLEDLVSLIMLSGDDALHGKCHPYFNWHALYNTSEAVPSKDMVELTTGLAGRSPSCFGHDSCDKWSGAKAIIKAAGLSENWGHCKSCKGEGSVWDSQENKIIAENWEPQEPPRGDGFQLWENVSEGSPISPVFSTPEELASWLVSSPDYKWASNDRGTTYDQWLAFIRGPGYAPSMIGIGGKMLTGVQALSEFK